MATKSNGNGEGKGEGSGLPAFLRFSRATSRLAGRPATFAVVVLVVVAWAVSGPLFGYSESWQLTINTLTTIVTFLMVFLIQATQNRDAEAIQLKLDELIVSLEGPRDELVDSENLSDEEQLALHRRYLQAAERARSRIKSQVRDLEEARGRRRRRKGDARGR
jgi:low affinity Fe/Cu permease